jgi:hypothetical protein
MGFCISGLLHSMRMLRGPTPFSGDTMADVDAAQLRDDLLSRFSEGLVTRTLAQVAEEARQDGESLQDLVTRYEIDYAWHVLGSERTRQACLAALEARGAGPAPESQRVFLAALLEAAAAAQPVDALMSFDNDVPALLGQLLGAWFEREAVAAV